MSISFTNAPTRNQHRHKTRSAPGRSSLRCRIFSAREVSMSYDRRLGAAPMIFTTLAPACVCVGAVVRGEMGVHAV